jgi:hypothetical protein
MTIIDWMNQLLVYKKPWDEFTESEQKSFSPFIVNRFLSMDTDFIAIINFLQKYTIGMMESKDIYTLYCNLLPKGKRYNKYIKSKKAKKYNSDLVDILIECFECSKLHVEEYIEILKREEIENILIKYGKDSKTIKKMLK